MVLPLGHESRTWRPVEQSYHAVLATEPGRRIAYLIESCGGDEELRREVESLLKQENSADGLTGTLAVGSGSRRDGRRFFGSLVSISSMRLRLKKSSRRKKNGGMSNTDILARLFSFLRNATRVYRLS
jgi:hypothetical protein